MVEEIDIWRAASEIVKQYGKRAPHEAAKRAELFSSQNDYAGFAAWVKIKVAAEELLREEPEGKVH